LLGGEERLTHLSVLQGRGGGGIPSKKKGGGSGPKEWVFLEWGGKGKKGRPSSPGGGKGGGFKKTPPKSRLKGERPIFSTIKEKELKKGEQERGAL